jgi:hypothetical protein
MAFEKNADLFQAERILRAATYNKAEVILAKENR